MAASAGPLAGRRIWVTAQRRSGDLADALVRHGAEVTVASVLGVESALDDALLDRTREVARRPPDTLVVTTGAGFRDWCEAASTAGILEPLLAALRTARIVARGPKPRGALQAHGLVPEFVAASETSAELGAHLVERGVAGERVVVQHHAAGDAHLEARLSAAGASVVPVQVHRWASAPDPELVRRTALACARGDHDAVLFTSAPAAVEWLRMLAELGVVSAVTEQVASGSLLVAAVGPVTAEPLAHAGLSPVVPDRHRLGALAKLVTAELAS